MHQSHLSQHKAFNYVILPFKLRYLSNCLQETFQTLYNSPKGSSQSSSLLDLFPLLAFSWDLQKYLINGISHTPPHPTPSWGHVFSHSFLLSFLPSPEHQLRCHFLGHHPHASRRIVLLREVRILCSHFPFIHSFT